MPEKATQAKQTEKRWPRRAKGGGQKACAVGECKRPYRAKGYCYFHYKKWRQGELPHSRYRVCSKPECRAKALRHGLCEKHFDETYRSAKAPAAEAPAAKGSPAETAPAKAAPAETAPAKAVPAETAPAKGPPES